MYENFQLDQSSRRVEKSIVKFEFLSINKQTRKQIKKNVVKW